jgi:hypothetical protein
MLSNLSVAGQVVEDLTDREILIQLIEKFCHFKVAIKEIEINSDIVRREIISVDKRIYRNSIEINNLSEAYRGTIVRWNALLGLFATFILGIFVFMWRRSYNGRMVKGNK